MHTSTLSSTLENISLPVIGVNSDFRIRFANPAAEKLLGYKNQELIVKKLDQFLVNYQPKIPVIAGAGVPLSGTRPPARQGREDEEAIPSILELNRETICIDANNNKIPVSIAIKKICDKSKRTIGYIYVLKDISELKSYINTLKEKTSEIEQKNICIARLQQELEKGKTSSENQVKQQIHDFEEEYTKLFASINNLSLGFIMTDINNNIWLSNPAAINIFPSLATTSKTIKQMQESERIEKNILNVIEKSMREKKLINLSDIQVNTKYVNIFISPIISEKTASDCMGLCFIIEDKSKRHNLEESKENIFSIASHELRTPLTAIYGYSSLIKQIYFNDLQNQELKNIINAIGILSKKLSLSVNNFLDSSRLEQNKIELKKDECSLYAIINGAIKETEKLALEKNLYIKFDSPPAPVTITGDKTRLIQVLTILISNAVKFTQNGGIYISIQTLPAPRSIGEVGPNFVKVSIQDTGSGIPEQNKTLLFTKFQQTEESLLTRQEGAGLGLYIAKLLVEKMGGTIQLEKTSVNKGSTFSFTIPLKP